MKIELRHQPAFAVARLYLDRGEQVRAESGAMTAMTEGVQIEAHMDGGFLKALKRKALGGDSFFVTTYTASGDGGWVDVTNYLPGDIAVVTVESGKGIAVTRGSRLGHESGVEMDTKWGGARNLFGGEGGFVARMTGQGQVVVAAYGALDQHVLEAGTSIIVDSGHLVAYDDSLQMELKAAGGGIMNAVKSGEGIIVKMTGPGRVWTQSRNPNALVTWLTEVLPFARNSN